MSANLVPTPSLRFTDTSTGLALVGGLVYTYAAGTSTPQATYTDSTGGVANANPIVLNSRGECNCWLDPTLAYKIVVKDSLGNSIATYDQVKAPVAQYDIVASSGSSVVGFIATGGSAVQRTVQDKLRDAVSVKDFGAKGDGSTDDTAAIQGAYAQANSSGRALWFPGGAYLLSSAITVPFAVCAIVEGYFTGSGSLTAGKQINLHDGWTSGFGFLDPRGYAMKAGSSSYAAANSTAWAAMVSDCIAQGVYEIFIPPGNWYLNATANVTAGIMVRGVTESVSVLVQTLAGADVLQFTGQYGTGGGVRNLTLAFASGVAGNVALLAQGTSSYQPDFLCIENVNITTFGTNTMSYGMVFDGTARHPVSGLMGLRNTMVKNVALFNVTGGNMVDVRYCKTFYGKDLQLNQGGGTVANISVTGYDSLNKSTGVHLSGCIASNLAFDTTATFSYVGGAVYTGTTITAACSDGLVATTGGGTMSNTGTNVRVL